MLISRANTTDMNKALTALFLSGAFFWSTSLSAQPDSRYFNVGLGLSNWGVPVFGTIEIPLKFQNQRVIVGGSFRTKRESFSYLGSSSAWRHTIVGIEGGWSCYFDDLADLPSEFDVYGGLRLGYYFWSTRLTDNIDGFNDSYTGLTDGLGLRGVIGGRYHYKSDKSLFLELGGGNVTAGGRFGLSFSF